MKKHIYLSIGSEHLIQDDWYVIDDDYFEIELLNYDTASQVEFYILRLESDGGPSLVFTDADHKDGWKYSNETIGEIISKLRVPDATYTPYFLMYAEVTMEDGSVVKMPNIPIYHE